MDWTKIAIDKLIKYPIKKEALKNLKAQLAALEAKSTSLKGFVTDKIPTSGGGDMYTDKQLDIIVEKDELLAQYNITRKEIIPTENALNKLTEEEQWLLDTYIKKLKGYAFANAAWNKFHVEKTEAYDRRAAALKKFTLLLYGVIEN